MIAQENYRIHYIYNGSSRLFKKHLLYSHYKHLILNTEHIKKRLGIT